MRPFNDRSSGSIIGRTEILGIEPEKESIRWIDSPVSGYCESFNGKLRDELLNGEIFYSLKEAQIVIERWRNHYNTIRPHSSLGYRPPAPQAFGPFMPKLDQVTSMQ